MLLLKEDGAGMTHCIVVGILQLGKDQNRAVRGGRVFICVKGLFKSSKYTGPKVTQLPVCPKHKYSRRFDWGIFLPVESWCSEHEQTMFAAFSAFVSTHL